MERKLCLQDVGKGREHGAEALPEFQACRITPAWLYFPKVMPASSYPGSQHKKFDRVRRVI